MQYKTKRVSLRRIYLDNINPRHDPIDNEPDIVAHLIAHEQVKALAADIAARGTSPLERLAAVPHTVAKNSFIAVEGNRRVCALKLLSDPEKAPEAHRPYFRKLAEQMEDPPEHLEVVEFDSRATAKHWIDLRHGGARNGVGTRQWTTAQKTRFDLQGSSPTNPNAQALQVMEYAVEHGLITVDEGTELSITTLTRFLSNPVFRNVLGLANSKDLTVLVPKDEFDRAVEKFLRDALVGKDSGVHSRTTKREREDYSRKLQKQGIAPARRLDVPVNVSQKPEPPKPDTSNTPVAPVKKRDNRSPDNRATVIPSNFKARITDNVLKRLYDELKNLDTWYAFSCAYLLRAIVERSAKLFLKKRGKGIDADLHVLIGRVADELQKDGVPATELKYLRVMASDRDSRASPETLGAFVHGGQIPTSVELARAWDNIQDNMSRLFTAIE
ncbi:hypothetical protein [Pandoraea sputorum]|uniref:ParB/Sulfiredoxin domain-containing protein n=1 Tax=Pandoraea sputorum TaxID=93222 RepID=A0A5E5B506_9BURK|nr:hypothetical protein [Pandoraea sputorum]VVE80247.1 hypothetical protein PSP31121_02665 [Pandoraea sputorum]